MGAAGPGREWASLAKWAEGGGGCPPAHGPLATAVARTLPRSLAPSLPRASHISLGALGCMTRPRAVRHCAAGAAGIDGLTRGGKQPLFRALAAANASSPPLAWQAGSGSGVEAAATISTTPADGGGGAAAGNAGRVGGASGSSGTGVIGGWAAERAVVSKAHVLEAVALLASLNRPMFIKSWRKVPALGSPLSRPAALAGEACCAPPLAAPTLPPLACTSSRYILFIAGIYIVYRLDGIASASASPLLVRCGAAPRLISRSDCVCVCMCLFVCVGGCV